MANTTICGQCRFEFEVGAHVCQGCRGDIVYGETQYESAEALKLGAFVYGAGALALIYGLPIAITANWGTQLAPGWGMGFYGLIPAAIAAGFGGWQFTNSLARRSAGRIRTFRR